MIGRNVKPVMMILSLYEHLINLFSARSMQLSLMVKNIRIPNYKITVRNIKKKGYALSFLQTRV
jgi:hypothetical protein